MTHEFCTKDFTTEELHNLPESGWVDQERVTLTEEDVDRGYIERSDGRRLHVRGLVGDTIIIPIMTKANVIPVCSKCVMFWKEPDGRCFSPALHDGKLTKRQVML